MNLATEERFAVTIINIIEVIEEFAEIHKIEIKSSDLLKKIPNMYDKNKILVEFIDKTKTSWDKIYDKDTNYFLNLADIFIKDIDKIKIRFLNINSKMEAQNIRTLFGKLSLLEREHIWKGVHILVKQSILYSCEKEIKIDNREELIKKWNIIIKN